MSKIAYHFVGTFETTARRCPDIFTRMAGETDKWRKAWMNSEVPGQFLTELHDDYFMLVDTRDLAQSSPLQFLDCARASAAVIGGVALQHEQDGALIELVATVRPAQDHATRRRRRQEARLDRSGAEGDCGSGAGEAAVL
jgi:hypothetical protein